MPRMSRIGKGHTSVLVTDSITVVRYYSTDVVAYDPLTNQVKLNNGGYATYSTKVRMNQAANQFDLGYCVHQDKGEWFVNIDGVSYPYVNDVWYTL